MENSFIGSANPPQESGSVLGIEDTKTTKSHSGPQQAWQRPRTDVHRVERIHRVTASFPHLAASL